MRSILQFYVRDEDRVIIEKERSRLEKVCMYKVPISVVLRSLLKKGDLYSEIKKD